MAHSPRVVSLRFKSAKVASYTKENLKLLGHEAEVSFNDDTLVCCSVPFWPLSNSDTWVKWRLAVLGGGASASEAIFAMPTTAREQYLRRLNDLLYNGARFRIVRIAFEPELPESRVLCAPVPIRPSQAELL